MRFQAKSRVASQTSPYATRLRIRSFTTKPSRETRPISARRPGGASGSRGWGGGDGSYVRGEAGGGVGLQVVEGERRDRRVHATAPHRQVEPVGLDEDDLGIRGGAPPRPAPPPAPPRP